MDTREDLHVHGVRTVLVVQSCGRHRMKFE